MSDKPRHSKYQNVYDFEFKQALHEISNLAPQKLNDPFDRVRIMEWIRKLNEMNPEKLRNSRIRNEYAQYLRIMLKEDQIHIVAPFKNRPPMHKLPTLAELLANALVARMPNLPRNGPIQPVVCNKSDDGKSFMTVKRSPDGGVVCYMGVSPNSVTKVES